MTHRAASEHIAEGMTLLAQARDHLDQQRRIIARRRKLGSDLTESLTLLETLELIVKRREHRLEFHSTLAE